MQYTLSLSALSSHTIGLLAPFRRALKQFFAKSTDNDSRARRSDEGRRIKEDGRFSSFEGKAKGLAGKRGRRELFGRKG
jgi:hypothetical protein